jgi:rhodanese-related sulfurtransferase
MTLSDPPPIPEVEPSTAYEGAVSNGALILDVREIEELQQLSIAESLHIPLGEMQARLSEIPVNRDVFVICHVGQRSAMATGYLRTAGFERIANIRGGIVGWLRAGLPVNWGSG